MNFKISKKDMTINCILHLIIAEILILNWLNISSVFSILFLVTFSAVLIKNIRLFRWDLFIMSGLMVYLIFNAIYTSSASLLFLKNTFHLCTTFCIIIFVCYTIEKKKKWLVNKMLSLWKCINIYMIINIPVLILQWNGFYALSGFHSDDNINNFGPDLTSGLLGYNGTHWLALFSSFVFIYNIWFLQCSKMNANGKYILWVYNILLLAFNVWISTINDNKVFYLLVIMFYLFYLYNERYIPAEIRGYKIGKNFIFFLMKMWMIIGAVLMVVLIVYSYTDVGNIIDYLIGEFVRGENYASATGSAERVGTLLYFFYSGIDKIFGLGIGQSLFTQPYFLGFKHFGTNNLDPFFCLGGACLVFLINLVFLYEIRKIFPSYMHVIVSFFIFNFLLFYTMPLTRPSAVIGMMLNFMIISLAKEKKKGIMV